MKERGVLTVEELNFPVLFFLIHWKKNILEVVAICAVKKKVTRKDSTGEQIAEVKSKLWLW